MIIDCAPGILMTPPVCGGVPVFEPLAATLKLSTDMPTVESYMGLPDGQPIGLARQVFIKPAATHADLTVFEAPCASVKVKVKVAAGTSSTPT